MKRKQVYNPIEIIDFVITDMTEYYQRRLNDFAISRNVNQHLVLEKAMERSKSVDIDGIEDCGGKTYLVPSCSTPDVKHVVDTAMGSCTCEFGMYGRFCKHMAAVFTAKKVPMPNFPGVTTKDRQLMAWVAFGDNVMHMKFYRLLHGDQIDECQMVCS